MRAEENKQPEPEGIYGVLVPEREEGFYLFADLHDAEAFVEAIRDHGAVAELSEELLYPYLGAGELIAVEAIAMIRQAVQQGSGLSACMAPTAGQGLEASLYSP